MAGLLLGCWAPTWAVATAALAVLGLGTSAAIGSQRATGACLVLIAAAVVGGERVRQLERPAGQVRVGTSLTGELTALEPLRHASAAQPRRGLMRAGHVLFLVRARGQAPSRIDTGDVVHVEGRVVAATRGARALRAHATLDADLIGRTGRRRGGLAGRLDSIRRRSMAVLGADRGPAGALVAGVVLGQDDRLSPGLEEQMRAAGLTHLTAASGQNVAFIAAIAAFAGLIAGTGVQTRWLLALALIVVYVPLCGAGPSIVRAGIMGAATIAAAIAGRPGSRLDALLLAAALTLGHDPRIAADLGWQLSFAAVIGIAAVAPVIARRLVRLHVPHPIATVVAATLAATLATAPLLAVRVQRPSPWSIPANVLAAPAIPALMAIGVPAAVVGQFAPEPGARLARAARVPAAYLIVLAQRFSEPPTLVRIPPPAHGTMRITALDVGQGDATLIQAAGAAVLVDSGPPGTSLVAQLRKRSVSGLDALVLTHAELDHVGAVPELLDRLSVRLVIDGRAGVASALTAAIDRRLARCGCRVASARSGLEVGAGALSLRTLWPPDPSLPAAANPNDHAVVMTASAFGRRALLTADAESPVLTRLELGRIDLLKVSHHGSADPGLAEVLDRVRPQMAVIEVGRHNRHGHPVREVLDALHAAGVATWRTDLNGATAFELSRGTETVRPERP